MEPDVLEQLIDWVRSRYFGKYRGVVKDNADETKRGRLKVHVPSVLGGLEIWAMPCVPYAGAGVGFYCLPEPETGVWVEFEGGDPSFPVWTGFFWADDEIPDDPEATIKIWKTEKFTLRIDDENDEFLAKTSSDSSLTMTDETIIESGGAKQSVGPDGVVSEMGGTKSEVTDSSFSVNSGAFEVS